MCVVDAADGLAPFLLAGTVDVVLTLFGAVGDCNTCKLIAITLLT